jgi:DNA-binding transcriptional MerR regulator
LEASQPRNNELPDRRYSISEVSELVDVPIYVLRQWEAKIPQLRPKRNRSNRRYYLPADIEIVRRIKRLLRHEKMTLDGVRLRLAEELHGDGRVESRQEAIDLIDRIQVETRRLLDRLDKT